MAFIAILLLCAATIGLVVVQKAKTRQAAILIESRGGFVTRTPASDWMKTNVPHQWHASLLTPIGVDIYDTTMDERLLTGIASLRDLEELSLDGSNIGDRDLVFVARLPKLKRLSLIRTRITDSGIGIVGEMQGLKELFLSGTSISDDGHRELKRRLPKCEIYP